MEINYSKYFHEFVFGSEGVQRHLVGGDCDYRMIRLDLDSFQVVSAVMLDVMLPDRKINGVKCKQ